MDGGVNQEDAGPEGEEEAAGRRDGGDGVCVARGNVATVSVWGYEQEEGEREEEEAGATWLGAGDRE